MVSAITATATPFIAPSPTTARPAASPLDSQLAQYQIQLADWTSCPSCRTPEGKAKIAEITDKISDIQRQISRSEVSSTASPATLSTAPPAQNSPLPAVSPASSPAATPSSRRPVGLIGNQIDTFA